MIPCSPREAKNAFILADRMKGPGKDTDLARQDLTKYRDVLLANRADVEAMADESVDVAIGTRDATRLRRYSRAIWSFGAISLSTCFVYNRMGSRKWIDKMLVPEAAESIRQRNDSSDRLWRMKELTQLVVLDLPIIILATGGKVQIDDGSHRAVAAWLAGIKELPAFVGHH